MQFKRKLIAIILSAFLLVLLLPATVFAAGPVDLETDIILTVDYQQDVYPITDCTFHIYKIADTDAYTKMTLTPEFAEYPIELDCKDQEEWQALAETLKGYVEADEIPALAEDETDENGIVAFGGEGSGYKAGLYLFLGDKKVIDDYTYFATPGLIYIPEATLDNDWNYDVVVNQKYSQQKNPPVIEHIDRKVLKEWNDSSNKANRPKSVGIDLLRDGEVVDHQILTAENNWRYTWEDLEANDEEGVVYEYTVKEDTVSGYTTKVSPLDGITFVVTNTANSTPVTPPVVQTGQLWWPIPVLICAGLVCIIIGLVIRRRTKS